MQVDIKAEATWTRFFSEYAPSSLRLPGVMCVITVTGSTCVHFVAVLWEPEHLCADLSDRMLIFVSGTNPTTYQPVFGAAGCMEHAEEAWNTAFFDASLLYIQRSHSVSATDSFNPLVAIPQER